MRCDRWVIALALVVFTGSSAASLLAAEANLPQAATSPARLVQAALESELSGTSEVRGDLLKQALALDPDYAPARWQSGFVRWDGQWLTPEEVASRAKSDPLLAEYRRRRDALVDRADDHRALAAWCHKNKLADAERVHWLKVLEFESNDPQALAALGLEWHQGRLLTKQQLERAKQAAVAQQQATRRWQPQFIKWRQSIDSGNAKRRDAALAELAKIAEPAALPALESVFGAAGDSKKARVLYQIFIETVSHIPGPEATAVLLRASLLPESTAKRADAADALKKRPPHAYVPQLIAALPGSLSTRFEITLLPNGTVIHEHQLQIDGRSATIALDFASTAGSDVSGAGTLTPAAASKELARAARIESQARATQAILDRRRERVQFVLERTTGVANLSDPELVEKLYNDYHGWRSSPQAKPTYYQSSTESYGYATTPSMYTLTNPTPPPPPHSCFPAGTQVLTAEGPRPIETLKVGDGVLTQGTESGELTFKPVQTRTLRPRSGLLALKLGADTIQATPGHPFWVVGQGWRTAKQLKAGDRLHTLNGSVKLDGIDESAATEVYNLIVNDSHNYFVGSSLLLAHDNSPLVESASRVPGLAATELKAQ